MGTVQVGDRVQFLHYATIKLLRFWPTYYRQQHIVQQQGQVYNGCYKAAVLDAIGRGR